MSTITNLKELNKRKCLKYEDKVIFTVKEQKITYEVKETFLSNKNNSNNKIFMILNIDKSIIAEKTYGYETRSMTSDWPTSITSDFPALTRLVRELYIIIEEKEPKYTPYNRFEIMDI